MQSAEPNAAQATTKESAAIEWEAEMSLLNNRFFLGDWLKWSGLTMLICTAIFIPLFGISGGRNAVETALLFLIIPPVLMVGRSEGVMHGIRTNPGRPRIG